MNVLKMILKGFLLLFMVLLCFPACKETPKAEVISTAKLNEWGEVEEPDLPIPDWMEKDTVKRKLTDTLVAYAISYATDSTQRYVLYPTIYSENDSIAYTILNNRLSNIITRITRPALELYLEYYFADGDLKYIRHREWNQRPENCGAREINFYLENKTINFVRERHVVLDLNEPPARIAFKKLQPSQRTIDVLTKDKDEYWPAIIGIVEKDLQMRSSQ